MFKNAPHACRVSFLIKFLSFSFLLEKLLDKCQSHFGHFEREVSLRLWVSFPGRTPGKSRALDSKIENDASKKKIVKLKYHHVDSTQTVLAHRHEADVTSKNIARIANECHSLTVISLS